MPDSTYDRRVLRWVEDAEDRVFTTMHREGYNRDGGSNALSFYPEWRDAWHVWWDEGED